MGKLDIKNFKIIRNRQKPDFAWMHELEIGIYRFRILTMDGGFSYTASIEKHIPSALQKHRRKTIFSEKVDFEFMAPDLFKSKLKELKIEL